LKFECPPRQFQARVTRLGAFSPIGWLFSLGSFFFNCENSPIFWLLLFLFYIHTF
jgi:hypothetical protein